MILPIVKYGDPILRKKGDPIATIDDDILQLIQDMTETMEHANGLGLAAQQIGKALQLAIVDVSAILGDEERPSKMWIDQKEADITDHMPLALINPELEFIKSKETAPEGCLSFPGLSGDITRPKRVKVTTLTPEGDTLRFEAAGMLGRAIQHEFDHLQGTLFIDRMSPEERKELRDEIEAIKAAPLSQEDSSA